MWLRPRGFGAGLILMAAAIVPVVACSSEPSAEPPAGEASIGAATQPTRPVGADSSAVQPQPVSSRAGVAENTASSGESSPGTIPDSIVSGGDDPGTATRESPVGGIEADLEAVLRSLTTSLDTAAVGRLVRSGDLRVAWILADLMRFIHPQLSGLSNAFTELTGVELGTNPWKEATDKLIEWDTPALPGFGEWKGQVYTLVEPRWAPFFADRETLIDWRHVTWGGVLIDDRPLDRVDSPCPRGCIPALNDPQIESATVSDYYPDDRLVFAVVINGEAVAFPKNMMEVHEMVNITVGGRRLGIPYCTLCGSAQAYFTDEVPEPVQDLLVGAETFELRTSGLLSRSNKMMYEFHTFSMFDTFTGRAVSGPLREAGIRLPQTTVVASSWGEWKEANPHTYIVVEDGGIGRSYPEDPLRGRDDHGPIFPTGDVDGRLPVQEKVLGVLVRDGSASIAVAFPVAMAHEVLRDGGSVEHAGIVLSRDGGGLRARGPDGKELPAHEAFWFAWSQFHPGTELWRSGEG